MRCVWYSRAGPSGECPFLDLLDFRNLALHGIPRSLCVHLSG